jgi:hypothetical protein
VDVVLERVATLTQVAPSGVRNTCFMQAMSRVSNAVGSKPNTRDVNVSEYPLAFP